MITIDAYRCPSFAIYLLSGNNNYKKVLFGKNNFFIGLF